MEKNFPRPSASHQWKFCSGSFALQKKFPESESASVDNTAREEGLACHWVGEMLLISFMDEDVILTFENFKGKMSPNKIVITEEIFEGALAYFDYVTEVIDRSPTVIRDHVFIEKSVNLDHILEGMNGTPDCYFFDGYTNTLYVFDLKFGFSLVEIFENPQFIIYASGILKTLHPQVELECKVCMVVIQPRASHMDGIIRSWTTKATNLRGYVNQLHYMAHKAVGEDPECVVGKHCKNCSGIVRCVANQMSSYTAIDVATSAMPNNLSGDELALEYSILEHAFELIKSRKTALKEQLLYEIRTGKKVNGYGVASKYGWKIWKKDIDQNEVLQMGKLMKVDLSTIKLDTPTQVIAKLKKAKQDVSFIDEYSFRPLKGTDLVKDDLSKIKRIFGDNNNG